MSGSNDMDDLKFLDYLCDGYYIKPRRVADMLEYFPIQARLYDYFLKNAVFKPEGIYNKGVKLERGQVVKSLSKISEELAYVDKKKPLEYPKQTLSYNIKRLVELGLIKVLKTVEIGTVYEVVNYNITQDLKSYSNKVLDAIRTRYRNVCDENGIGLGNLLDENGIDIGLDMEHKNISTNGTDATDATKETHATKATNDIYEMSSLLTHYYYNIIYSRYDGSKPPFYKFLNLLNEMDLLNIETAEEMAKGLIYYRLDMEEQIEKENGSFTAPPYKNLANWVKNKNYEDIYPKLEDEVNERFEERYRYEDYISELDEEDETWTVDPKVNTFKGW